MDEERESSESEHTERINERARALANEREHH
jgi:hypothetical protein